MFDWTFDQLLKTGLTLLVIFAFLGGIISQSSGGMSGRGFLEGMWKGVEWFLIMVVGIGILYGILAVMGMTSSALNT